MNILDNWKWEAPQDWLKIKTIDLHTGGEPLRVFTHGLPEIKGNTILEKRRYFRDNYDYIRTRTMWEPRGHADMYGAIITEATTEDGDFGTFFLHNEGYSTMCGHAMIALITLVLDTGMIVRNEANPIIRIDAPPGQITCQAFRNNGKVERVAFKNVPSFMSLKNQVIDVPELGKVQFDLAYGGAFYAYVQAEDFGLNLDESDYNKLIDYGRKIKYAVMDQFEVKHPFEEDLSFLYGTIFIGKAKDPKHHSRNVCIFAEGEVDRSPTGSGVSARAAIHYAKGELKMNEEITIESILGSTMTVKVVEPCEYGNHQSIIPEVSGTASITGQNEFYFAPNDPLRDGFIFR
ncbi:proline racemase [Ancylomarina euxinus]|uniref:Proline racemase n=1 Tax=Ancylomarina euxinus TaxID=2283627 RepID=A0A425XX42_9BACT|nr:proline racemase family protein [Ancylomarina euxinus]MCZ4696212.1 proline racemase family protein [Ancylomarina euxinus]MUP16424.1 proline racemase [Ancylomarina euxinus]RRG19215.1 proline racemase [Ancylomarina euxinus]